MTMSISGYRPSRRTFRNLTYMAYDATAIIVSLLAAAMLRMNGHIPPAMLSGLMESLPVFLAAGMVILHLMGVYNRVWRLASLPDLITLVQAATFAVLTPAFVLILTPYGRWMPTSVPIIQWFVLVALLSVGRTWQRIMRDAIARLGGKRVGKGCTDLVVRQQRALLVGRPDHIEGVLRHLELVPNPAFIAVGILDVDSQETNLRLRRVPILGGLDSIEHAVDLLTARNARPSCIVLVEGSDGLSGNAKLNLVTTAERLNMSVLRAPPPTEIHKPLDLEVINLADLLDRPQTELDASIVLRAMKGQRVLLTGAGGTIGRELARQIAAMEPSEIVLLDAGEFNLYSVEMELRENYPQVACRAELCSIRQRQHVMAIFADFLPHFVFHAAALKHVPLVEMNVCAGVQTNVIGTRNVADAAKAFGVRAMVQISTDKAVNPVGMMGATKRLGELYCQALDLQGVGDPLASRFMTVRFGNVLGSSGSLIPLFQRQLNRKVPLTVTHPEITRYFMTVHEAVQLVLHSMARAMECGVKRGRIIVLDMGEPVKIIEIARRMIRLAGLVPDRDVPIDIVGLRPGEKLYEELFDEREDRLPSVLTGVFEAEPMPIPLATLQHGFDALMDGIIAHDEEKVRSLVFKMLETPEKVAVPCPVLAGRDVSEALPATMKGSFVDAIWSRDVSARRAV
jgi:FlaA1/EpsC-like NDP-sugar epimerase